MKPIRRVSPSRYTAMRGCLLREVWTASGNEPLIPPSPLAELGSVIHELLKAAGFGQLEGGGNDKVDRTWLDLVSQTEKRMMLSTLRRQQVPLSRSIPNYEVRRLRACHRAAEIARDAFRGRGGRPRQSREHAGYELWVESQDGQVGGYIDRVTMTPDGVVLSDYKSGAVLISGKGKGPGILKQAYKDQLTLYAALYQIKCGSWPVRLEVVPLQGAPTEVAYDPGKAERLLMEASALLRTANKRIAEVESGRMEIIGLASPRAEYCRLCLFRPACQAYWLTRSHGAQATWPADVKGLISEITRLRNGKVCMRIAQDEPTKSSCITIRNLTDSVDRHPLLRQAQPETRVALYGLDYHYRSADYTETQDTVIFVNN